MFTTTGDRRPGPPLRSFQAAHRRKFMLRFDNVTPRRCLPAGCVDCLGTVLIRCGRPPAGVDDQLAGGHHPGQDCCPSGRTMVRSPAAHDWKTQKCTCASFDVARSSCRWRPLRLMCRADFHRFGECANHQQWQANVFAMVTRTGSICCNRFLPPQFGIDTFTQFRLGDERWFPPASRAFQRTSNEGLHEAVRCCSSGAKLLRSCQRTK